MPTEGLITGKDGKSRCWWPGDDPLYQRYHDEEWAHPVEDDIRLFEKICLEGFQAGLSWLTILRKRENFREAFSGFQIEKIVTFTESDIQRLLQNEGIIRHRGKIEAAINNAGKASAIIEEFGSLAAYIWQFEPEPKSRPERMTQQTARSLTQTEESEKLSRDLRSRGFKFVGPTTMYALMQATGMVNDHLEGCFCRAKIEKLRQNFKRPGLESLL